MLVLTRQAGQWLRIGADVRVQVVHARHGRVLLGVEAPRAVAVLREELVAGEPQPQREKENQKERDQDLRPSYSNSSTVSPYPELEIEEPRKLYEFEFEFERGARTVSARGEPRMTTDPVSTSGSTSMGARQSSSSTSLSGVGPDGAALAFYESLLALLPARSISDLTCFRRVAEWLADGVAGGRFRPDVFARVLLYARGPRGPRPQPQCPVHGYTQKGDGLCPETARLNRGRRAARLWSSSWAARRFEQAAETLHDTLLEAEADALLRGPAPRSRRRGAL